MVDINAIHDINSIVGQSASAAAPRVAESKKTAPPVEILPKRSQESGAETVETLERIKLDIKEVLSSINVKLQLEVDSESNKVVVKVIDPETNEVIKQIPSKEMLRIGKRVAQLLSTYTNSKKPMVNIFKDSKDTKVD